MIVRYGEPGKYDQADFGSGCKVLLLSHASFDLYIQTSKDVESPHWEFLQNCKSTLSCEEVERILHDRISYH